MLPSLCIKLFDSPTVSIVSSPRLISVISTLVSTSSFIKSGADPYWSIMSSNPELSGSHLDGFLNLLSWLLVSSLTSWLVGLKLDTFLNICCTFWCMKKPRLFEKNPLLPYFLADLLTLPTPRSFKSQNCVFNEREWSLWKDKLIDSYNAL